MKNSVLSVRIKTPTDITVGARKGNAIKQYVEPQVYASEFPMVHTFRMGTGRTFDLELKNSFGNKLIGFANYEIDNFLDREKIMSLMLSILIELTP